MKVSMIAAVALNGVIGRDKDLPWRIEDDVEFFSSTTRGHVVITGRGNFEAMRGEPLAERINVLVARRAVVAPGWRVTGSVEEGLRLARKLGEAEAFIIGGASIYAAAYPYAHAFYKTTVLASVEGDVSFPELDFSGWRRRLIERGYAGGGNEFSFVIEELVRPEAPLSFE